MNNLSTKIIRKPNYTPEERALLKALVEITAIKVVEAQRVEALIAKMNNPTPDELRAANLMLEMTRLRATDILKLRETI